MQKFYLKAQWPGRNDLSKQELSFLWHNLKAEKSLNIIFFDGPIELNDLINLALNPWNHFALIYNKNKQAQAFFWLNHHLGLSAMLHFGFLKVGLKNKYDIAKFALHSCFNGGLKSLYSLTPTYNIPARSFAKKLAGLDAGILPKALYIHKIKKYVDASILIFNAKSIYK